MDLMIPVYNLEVWDGIIGAWMGIAQTPDADQIQSEIKFNLAPGTKFRVVKTQVIQECDSLIK